MNKEAAHNMIKAYEDLGVDPTPFIKKEMFECKQLLAEEENEIWIKRLTNSVNTYAYALALLGER